MQTEANPLGYKPVGKLLGTFAVPSIISMVVSTLYNIVDQIFIGRGVGYLGNGATNVILPLTVIALALGLMIGDGTTAYFSLRPRWKLCGRVCSLGISSFFLQLAATIVIAVMNNVLAKYGAASKYGAEIPMTTLGITMKVNQIITGIVIGISVGSQPIIGYNYGAGKTARAKKTYLLAIVCSTIVMGVGTLLLQLFPDSIVSIFGSESDLYREFAVKSLKIFLLLILLNGFQLCTGTFFQAIGKPVQATLISLSRQVLFLLPALLIIPRFLGVEGALWAGPVGDACAFVLALIFGLVEWRKTNLSAQATT